MRVITFEWLKNLIKEILQYFNTMAADMNTSSSIGKVFQSTWFTGSDRTHLKTLLFDENVENQKKGLRRLAAWTARSHPSVPLGLEVTSSLLTALIASDEATSADNEAEKRHSSDLLLALSLVRFVNLVLRTKKAQGGPTALIIIAAAMGLPQWLVEVRHSISHSHMPSSNVLKKSCKYALKWLKDFYWEGDTPIDAPSNFCHVVDDAEKEAIVLSLQMSQVDVKSLDSIKNMTREDLIDVLTRDGVLLPTPDQLSDLSSEGFDVVTKLEQIWMPFLESLNRPDVSFQVLTSLIENTAKSNDASCQRIGSTLVGAFLKFFRPTVHQREALRQILLSIPLNATSISILEAIRSKMKVNETEKRNVSNENSSWILETSESWKHFPIGVDKDDWKWSPDKLELKFPTDEEFITTSHSNIEKVKEMDQGVKNPVKRKRNDEENDKTCSLLQQNVHLL